MVRILSIACAVLAVSVAALAFQVHDAQRRIDALESRAPAASSTSPHVAAARSDDDDDTESGPAGSGPGGGSRASFFGRPIPEAHASPLASSGAGGGDAGGDAKVVPAGAVPDLVRSEMQRIDDEKMQAREERQRKRIGKELDDLQTSANLSTDQRTQLQTMMEAELVEMRQLFTDARDNDAWSDLRDKLRATRAKTDENAGAVLNNDAQKQAYSAMREEERNRFLGAARGNRGD